MLNQVILVGQVMNEPEIIEMPDNKKKVVLELSVGRKYEDDESKEVERDIIPVHIGDGIAESTYNYVTKGSTVGVKACIVVEEGIISIHGEKVTFINSK